VLHVDHASFDICEQHDLVFHNINKDFLYVNVVFLVPWKVWILFYQFAWGYPLVRLPKAKSTLWVKNSFALSVLIHDVPFVDVCKVCYHIEQLVQWVNLMLKGLAWWVSSLSHHLITQIRINLWMLFHLM
jgi:hypothetical protein